MNELAFLEPAQPPDQREKTRDRGLVHPVGVTAGLQQHPNFGGAQAIAFCHPLRAMLKGRQDDMLPYPIFIGRLGA
ncbi:MAG: hypothetical protein F4213_09985 [Boseongicola sp. SB0677_bin_26]|nr:hypothetical protein [Boseongicola sp. SB0677_bin_26]